MDELILRSLQGRASELDERILLKWRRASPENEVYYRQLVRLWEAELPWLPPGTPPPVASTESILKRADDRRIQALPLHRRVVAVHGPWLRNVAVAAGLILLGFGLSQLRPGGNSPPPFGASELATGSAETVTVTLNDGSFVRLAPNSRIRITDQSTDRGAARQVWLEGRGYFAVASDPSRPFTVRTPVGSARALGTRFEVRVRQGQLRLAVSEGRVILAAGRREVELEAGQVTHVQPGQPPAVVQVEDVYELLDWPRGLLVFQSTPLRQVVRELEQHFDVPFEITDPKIGDLLVTGWFDDETLDEVLTAVCRATQTRCSLEAQRVIVRPAVIQ